jgi:hypothetical protein
METALTAALLASSGLTTLLGGASAARIHWDKLPSPEALPSLILHAMPSAADDYVMAGRTPTTEQWVQCDCWATTKLAAIGVRDALVAVCDGLVAPPLQAFIERRHAAWDRAQGADAAGGVDLYRVSLDVRVWHTP